jgi:hypothetical protein
MPRGTVTTRAPSTPAATWPVYARKKILPAWRIGGAVQSPVGGRLDAAIVTLLDGTIVNGKQQHAVTLHTSGILCVRNLVSGVLPAT